MPEINYSSELLDQEYASREPIRATLQFLKDTYGIAGKSVAEFGSGLGHNLDVFGSENTVIGIEGLQTAAAAATNRGVPTMIADLSADVPLEAESYDVALCLDVLEHLVEPRRCLREVHRILRVGGMIAVNVPNHFTLSGRINIARGSGVDSARFFPNHADWENPHIRFFRHSSILKLMADCAFHIEADWSARFPSIPIIRRWPSLQHSSLARTLAGRFPELFAGGFFILGRKEGPTSPR
jgi:SAM-dependent methyltransferase